MSVEFSYGCEPKLTTKLVLGIPIAVSWSMWYYGISFECHTLCWVNIR